MIYGVLKKNNNSPPFIISQYTYRFARCVLDGYEMLFQGEEHECINYLKNI
jgi:hypothetical protein